MADWFVYQRDLYPHEFDPDAFGITLVPVYDNNHSVIYRDAQAPINNGLRRVESKWGVDPNIVHYDMLMHMHAQVSCDGRPPLHSPSTLIQTTQWIPSQHSFMFYNTTHGFNFENVTLNQCLFVERDDNQHTCAKLMQKDTLGKYTVHLGYVVIMRIHALTLLTPEPLHTTWFSKYVTAHNTIPFHGSTTVTHRKPMES